LIGNELTTKNSTQNQTTYLPSRAARKLLEVLLNPEFRYKSVAEICKVADISRDSYYHLAHDKDFMCHYTRESQRLVRMHQVPMVSALVKSAVRGNPQNLKMAMTGLYQEKTGVVINPNAAGEPRPITVRSDMEIAVKIARIFFSNPKIMEIIQARIGGPGNPSSAGEFNSGAGKADLDGQGKLCQ
jgi:hypothetical protein